MENKKALIAVNFIGFLHFLWSDIDLLNELGYQVYVCADNRKNELHTLQMLEEKHCVFIDVRMDTTNPLSSKNWVAYRTISALLSKERFELIHCHTPITGLMFRFAARKYRKKGTKVIYTSHGLAYTHLSTSREYIKFHSIEYIASKWCDAIITINNEDFENAKKLCCKHVYHINGVGLDIDMYRNSDIDIDAYKKELGLPLDKIIIGAIGELSPRKNHAVIIKALGLLPNKNEYVFAIRGRAMTDDSCTIEMQRLASEFGVDLRLLGFKKDIPQFIYCVDIGVIPSKREGLGMAGLQQLCAGVPIIGTDVQGIREYCIDGETGVLVKHYNDVKGYSKAIKLLSDIKIRQKMANACKEIVNQFSLSKSIEQRSEIYSKILRD